MHRHALTDEQWDEFNGCCLGVRKAASATR
jgi:hypothetical protein